MSVRLGILLTHPTQYHSPWFRELAKRSEIETEVFYCFQPNATQQGIDFGVAFSWDTPLLEGYSSTFLQNISTAPGFHYSGCDTPEIKNIIESRRFDVWLINGWRVKSDWQAIRACWNSGTPMLVRGDSNLLDWRPSYVRFAKRVILGRWIPRFARYLTVGKLNGDYYEFYGADRAKFFPVRHFVENDRFAEQAEKWRPHIDQLHSKWKIQPNAIVFLFVGKFIPKKRPMDVVQAVERLAKKGMKIHLLMVGDGALRDECERYSRNRALPVTFAGFLNQSEIVQAYAGSDVLVLPSGYAETWGLVVNEAMSCGLPAIVSDRVGCGADLIMPEQTGMIFPVGILDRLVESMEMYARNPFLIRLHGENARRQVGPYSIEAAVQNTVSAVLSVQADRL